MRARVVQYLHGGRLLEKYLGLATCRYTAYKHSEFEDGISSGEFTDSVWAWPEGLFHYIEAHSVTLPVDIDGAKYSIASERRKPSAKGSNLKQWRVV